MPRSTARALSQRELNRATLARQLLLERARLPVARAVERLCAMQAQSAKAPYAGLWSRLEGFRREQLTRAYERKRVVRSTLFRVTMQLVSAADHPSFAALMHARWRDEFANWKLPAEEWSRRIVRLAEDGPFTYAAANAAVPELPERYRWRVRCLTPLVHVPPAGTWGNHRIHVTTAEQWLGASEVDTRAAAALLIERYLAGYGPASKADLQRFSGLRAGDVNAGFEELEPRLIQFEAEDGRTLFDLRRAKRPPADTPAPIRFLPEWDHLILGFDERSRVLPPDVAPAVIKKNGDVLPTFLVGRSRRRNLALRGRQGEDRAVRAASARRAAGARGRGPAPGSLSRVNPPTFDDVLAARERIAPHLRPTPLYRWPDLCELAGADVWVKHENHQPVGAFKVRGGVNLVSQLSEDERRHGLISASTGNHGQSIAFAAKLFGVRATICVPVGANPLKVSAIEALGAEIVTEGRDFDEAREHCEDLARKHGYRYVHSGDEPHLIAGVATEALEILEEQPETDVVIVPVGGGSGVAGACIAARGMGGSARVIGVQSEAAPAAFQRGGAGTSRPTR